VERALALFDRSPDFGTDRVTTGVLDLGKGRHVAFSCATESVLHQRVHLFGTKGRVEITIPFNQPQDATCTYFTHDGGTLDGLNQEPHVVPIADQYAIEADWFSHLVRTAQPTSTLLDDAIEQAKVLDALFRSEHSGRLEPVH
jgi:hypothetical protein